MHNNKQHLRTNTEGYGGKTYETGSKDSDTMAPSGRKLYYLLFLVLALNLGTSGYALVIRTVG